MRRNTLLVFGLGVIAVVYSYWRYKASFPPDARFYIYNAYRLGGFSPDEALARVSEYAAANGNTAQPEFRSTIGFQLARPRLLLSALAAPFVGPLGPAAVRGVAIGCCLALMPVLYRVAARVGRAGPALAVVALVVVSGKLVLLLTMPLTEAPTVLLMAIWLAVLPWAGTGGPKRALAILAVVCLLGTARQTAPYVAVPIAALWLWSRRQAPETRRAWTWVTAASLVGVAAGVAWTFVLGHVSVTDLIRFQTKATSTQDALADYPALLVKVLRGEFIGIVDERFLLVVLAGALWAAWRRRYSWVPYLVAGTLVSWVVITATNPVYTYLRTFLPLVPALVIAFSAGFGAWTEAEKRRAGLAAEPEPPAPQDLGPGGSDADQPSAAGRLAPSRQRGGA